MAKIGIDCRFYSPSFGIGRYIIELVRELSQIDNKNEYILFFNNPEFENFKEPAPNFKKVLCNAAHYSLSEQTKFLRIINQHQLDLMHFTNFNAPIFYKGKSVVTIHDLTLHFVPGNKLNKPWHRFAYHLIFKKVVNHASQIITVSNHTANDLNKLYPQTKNKTQAIHLGITHDFLKDEYPNIKKKYNLPKQYLLYAGNWRQHKNIPNLIKAFAILKNNYDYKGALVITGKPKPHHHNIPDLVKKLQLTNVHFVGLIPEADMPSLFHQAQAYIQPSFYEGFGLPALEAMQTKTPVIASNTTSLPEVCGDAALFFDPKDPDAMATQINKVISNIKVKNQLVKAGQNRVQYFSFKNMAKQTLNIYNDVL